MILASRPSTRWPVWSDLIAGSARSVPATNPPSSGRRTLGPGRYAGDQRGLGQARRLCGALGVPVEDERYDGDVISQKFTGGELSWNTASKTFTSDPPSFADELGGLEVPTDPTTLINQAWRATGGLGGPLGARQGEQTAVGDGGAAQDYASGKIFYSPATGAHAVTGAILSKYESLGGPTGDLGFPVGVETEGGVPNSRVSAFSAPDKPVIFWTPTTAQSSCGCDQRRLGQAGRGHRRAGVPTGEESVQGDTVTQNFSGGELSWNSASKEFSSKPPSLASSLSGAGDPGRDGSNACWDNAGRQACQDLRMALVVVGDHHSGLAAARPSGALGATSGRLARGSGTPRSGPNGDRWPGEGPVRARYQGPDVGSEGRKHPVSTGRPDRRGRRLRQRRGQDRHRPDSYPVRRQPHRFWFGGDHC